MCALTSNRPQPAYPCGQPELYTVATNGWTSYGEHLPRFSSLKTTYTAQKGLDALASVAAAEALPDEAAREAIHVLLRKELVNLGDRCLILWSDLSSYIRDGFPEEEYDAQRNAAGHGYYARASNSDWEGMKGLMKSGADFIAANDAALTAGGMPSIFVTRFTDTRTQFLAKYLEFTQAEELTKTMTDAKVEANNRVYRDLMAMFDDGQRIFRYEASVRHQFTFSRVLQMITNQGNGGGTPGQSTVVYGRVTDPNGMALSGVLMRLSGEEGTLEELTDINGRYRIEVPELVGTLEGTLTAEYAGMKPGMRPVTVVEGEQQEQDFVLTPEMP
jgi:hypothetical protein